MSKPKHHVRDSVCATRAPYREGRKAKAVKVYTVQQESKYLLVQGIPAVGAVQQLIALFASHGPVTEHRMLDDYPSEQFTDVCLVKFQKIQSARLAKRHLDDWSFYGGVLHVCYAPEYESVQDTREKLQDRRKAVAAKVRQHSQDGTYESKFEGQTRHSNSNSNIGIPSGSQDMAPALPETNTQSGSQMAYQTVSNYYSIEENESTSYIHMTGNQKSDWITDYRPNTTYNSDKPNDNRLVGQTTSSPGEETVNLCLPPPPKQTKFSNVPGSTQRTQKLGRGPSAQATFPPGFDARTDQQSGVSLTEYLARKGPNARTKEISDESKANSVQEKINESLKSSSVVVKQIPKKLSVPKFVPRQTQARFKQKLPGSVTATKTKAVSESERDAVNTDLKRNAFTLGQSQGPVDLEEHTRVRPGLEEVSVQKSVKKIREKLSQVAKTSNATQIKDR